MAGAPCVVNSLRAVSDALDLISSAAYKATYLVSAFGPYWR